MEKKDRSNHAKRVFSPKQKVILSNATTSEAPIVFKKSPSFLVHSQKRCTYNFFAFLRKTLTSYGYAK